MYRLVRLLARPRRLARPPGSASAPGLGGAPALAPRAPNAAGMVSAGRASPGLPAVTFSPAARRRGRREGLPRRPGRPRPGLRARVAGFRGPRRRLVPGERVGSGGSRQPGSRGPPWAFRGGGAAPAAPSAALRPGRRPPPRGAPPPPGALPWGACGRGRRDGGRRSPAPKLGPRWWSPRPGAFLPPLGGELLSGLRAGLKLLGNLRESTFHGVAHFVKP